MLISTVNILKHPCTSVDAFGTLALMMVALFVMLFFYALIADEYDGTVKDNGMTPLYDNSDILDCLGDHYYHILSFLF